MPVILLQPDLDDALDGVPSQAAHRCQVGNRHHSSQTLDQGLELASVRSISRGKGGGHLEVLTTAPALALRNLGDQPDGFQTYGHRPQFAETPALSTDI